ncbi:MAG: ABC transporter permease subunit [Armatimonadota bacterium]|nr:ABC transporter permease subunit [Armatimonadota bacterium]MDR7478942.1 ABC transporter permease subunit [Armatimonadota bacterium]MDR7488340.1 ABC transporter permease subunit [Armatimonadota bacterium]MDR7490020.1 ABC transporter permease subunit [Armatimonadota bacterium]MDR7502216.1 ABC transporter permease subunit [Armatimonadota bacterium]
MALPQLKPLPAGGPSAAGARPAPPAAAPAWRLRADRLAAGVVRLGGLAVVLSILAILAVILVEVLPLARPARARAVGTVPAVGVGRPLVADVDEHRQVAVVVGDGGLGVVPIGPEARRPADLPLWDVPVAGAARAGRTLLLGLSDGRALGVEVAYDVVFSADGRRTVTPRVSGGAPLVVDPSGRSLARVAYARTRAGPVVAAQTGPREVTLVRVRERRALVGASTREVVRDRLTLRIAGEVTALALDGRGDALFVGTSVGQLLALAPAGPRPRVLAVAQVSRQGTAITVLGFLLGDRTVITGDAAGRVASWQLLGQTTGRLRLQRIHEFAPLAAPVTAFAASHRDKGFLVGDADGRVHLGYGTTGETRLRVRAVRGGLRALAWAPKGDGFLAIDAAGRLSHWALEVGHPEATRHTLFGRVWYEGYEAPAYVWQSTGGTDDFEPKLSLTPLAFGTLKGTAYALLVAVPVALVGALYAAQFMHPTLRALVKPVVEIMAGLPSVVLGFLAGLWLAPRVERVVPGIILMPPAMAAAILAAFLLFRLVPAPVRGRVRPGMELVVLVPAVLLGGWLALRLGGLVEAALLDGDFRTWLPRAVGLTYDQRNALVVGLAMGFAVIPIVFTIAEDALANVPPHLAAGALALGATRWQTALRVVLPTASPGMFSAVMVGFGRAVGETMIVLMATGNTPVMDWSPFSGFRALSANVAVELPEAPYGGTLYRVLFLAALLLFVTTFLVNTAAEVVRLRLRRRYQAL